MSSAASNQTRGVAIRKGTRLSYVSQISEFAEGVTIRSSSRRFSNERPSRSERASRLLKRWAAQVLQMLRRTPRRSPAAGANGSHCRSLGAWRPTFALGRAHDLRDISKPVADHPRQMSVLVQEQNVGRCTKASAMRAVCASRRRASGVRLNICKTCAAQRFSKTVRRVRLRERPFVPRRSR